MLGGVIMDILDVFKDSLQDGMEITKCKELSNKYKLTLSYNRMSALCELNKLCTPGNEKSLCMQAIDNAMSTMYLGKGDLKEAEAWLHGERWNQGTDNYQDELYRVLYKGINGGFQLSDDMIFDVAIQFRNKCLNMGYDTAYVIQIVE